MSSLHRSRVECLEITVTASPPDAGQEAGKRVTELLTELTGTRDVVRIVFASAPSQRFLLEYLASAPDIDWRKVHAFHMDEYVDLPPQAPQRFGVWLTNTFFRHVNLGAVTLMRTDGDLDDRARDYAAAIGADAVDLVCMGIGENGHLAFNDPPDVDLNDAEPVRAVTLAARSREQQVGDGLFSTVDSVPRYALTLTVPRLMNSHEIVCIATGTNKRDAVEQALYGPISADCPASILRTHPSAHLYLDAGSDPTVRA